MNNNLITGVLAGVSGVLSYIFGPWDAMIMVLIAVVALDYITGVAYAAVSKTLSSAIGFKGLLKKVFIFVLVALSTTVPCARRGTHTAAPAGSSSGLYVILHRVPTAWACPPVLSDTPGAWAIGKCPPSRTHWA